MKKIIGMFAVAAALLFAGFSAVTPAAAASPAAPTSVSHEKAGVNTDISAQYYYPRRRYYAPRRYIRPRYYAPRRYIVPRFYAPRPYYYY